MQVHNLKNTSDNICKCDSWLEHWVRFGGNSLPPSCSVVGCYETPQVGGHVQKSRGLLVSDWFIIPICKKHNAQVGRSLTISDSTTLVSANVAETCG